MKYTFSFRGLELFSFDPETKDIVTGITDGIPAFNLCKFIPDDYDLLSRYFANIHKFIEGELESKDLINIEVY